MPARPTYERRARAPRHSGSAERVAPSLRALAKDAFNDVWIHVEDVGNDDGDVFVAFLRAGRADETPTVTADGIVIAYRRPLRVDLFRYHVAEGRLAITTAEPLRVDAFAAAFGAALHDDPAFFTDAPSVTLKPLLALGPSGVARARLPGGVRRAEVIAAALNRGTGDRGEDRGPRASRTRSRRRAAGGA